MNASGKSGTLGVSPNVGEFPFPRTSCFLTPMIIQGATTRRLRQASGAQFLLQLTARYLEQLSTPPFICCSCRRRAIAVKTFAPQTRVKRPPAEYAYRRPTSSTASTLRFQVPKRQSTNSVALEGAAVGLPPSEDVFSEQLGDTGDALPLSNSEAGSPDEVALEKTELGQPKPKDPAGAKSFEQSESVADKARETGDAPKYARYPRRPHRISEILEGSGRAEERTSRSNKTESMGDLTTGGSEEGDVDRRQFRISEFSEHSARVQERDEHKVTLDEFYRVVLKKEIRKIWLSYLSLRRSGAYLNLDSKNFLAVVEALRSPKSLDHVADDVRKDAADALWTDYMRLPNQHAHADVLREFVHLYADIGDLAGVNEVANVMHRDSIVEPPGSKVTYRLIETYARNGEFRAAYRSFEEATGTKYSVHCTEAANAFLKGCAMGGREAELLQMFGWMMRKGIPHDFHTYHHLIAYYALKKDLVNAEAAFEGAELLASAPKSPPIPMATWALVLHLYMGCNEHTKAQNFIRKMEEWHGKLSESAAADASELARLTKDPVLAWKATNYRTKSFRKSKTEVLRRKLAVNVALTFGDLSDVVPTNINSVLAKLDQLKATLESASVPFNPITLRRLLTGYYLLHNDSAAEVVLQWYKLSKFTIPPAVKDMVVQAYLFKDTASAERVRRSY
ncbi:uncharacterized protein EV422DRAFT_297685 [Fimicolochytrium jonesii]|uniref:uncharacterized protein n=1 Tax=Fimicolochytrium jonesii TaxID=1396493 RepID=UPI0022FE4705|nr:uncharacterized protein EV422DRAFT_297685 [Fimicolochytrium jonesii]KAI8816353.1 hypothetical protein EV422DRAFT_297685 [Fimicolochytrium jonesii]